MYGLTLRIGVGAVCILAGATMTWGACAKHCKEIRAKSTGPLNPWTCFYYSPTATCVLDGGNADIWVDNGNTNSCEFVQPYNLIPYGGCLTCGDVCAANAPNEREMSFGDDCEAIGSVYQRYCKPPTT